MSSDDLKNRVASVIDAESTKLVELSHRINSHPETAFQETQAAAWLSDLLEGGGFSVAKGVGGLDSAFCATSEALEPGPIIALITEYDALPGVGHGCGHNLISAGVVGAALGLQAVMPKLSGVLQILGTPGEESTLEPGGKIRLVEAGVFEGIDAALMFHPWTATHLIESDLAVTVLDISFQGRAAHAAADPWKGLNALDGVLLTYMNINALRQHVKSHVRIHGIVTDGGDVPNVVPERASARFMIRSVDKDYLKDVAERVEDCAKGAALATGTEVSIQRLVTIENTTFNRTLQSVLRDNLRSQGVDFEEGLRLSGSTDFGNMSQQVPSCRFMLKTHPSDTNWHSQEVAELAISDKAHGAMLIGAKILAMSCIDLFLEPGLVKSARDEFERSRQG
jgi:amidohydrolase